MHKYSGLEVVCIHSLIPVERACITTSYKDSAVPSKSPLPMTVRCGVQKLSTQPHFKRHGLEAPQILLKPNVPPNP